MPLSVEFRGREWLVALILVTTFTFSDAFVSRAHGSIARKEQALWSLFRQGRRALVQNIAIGGTMGLGSFSEFNADPLSSSYSLPLPDHAYTSVGDMRVCRVLNGLWQLSGAHGYKPELQKSLKTMVDAADNGMRAPACRRRLTWHRVSHVRSR
jgi:hypothetical protein